MEDDAPRKPSPRSASARPAKRPSPPAAVFMEPTVPSARRPPEPAPTPPDEPPAARKAAPAKKAAPKPPEDSPPAPAKRTTPAKKTATTVSATARTAPAKKAAPARKAEPPAPAKKAAAKKAAPAKKATPVKKAEAVAPPAAVVGPAPSWTRLPNTPEAVPEWLAHVAVERFGDQADRYVRWLRETYPNATPDGLARASVERLARRGWYTALAGPVGVAALLSAQAALVLHIAAAYGRDPRDPARVPELLALIEPKAAGAVLLGRAAGRLLPGAGALVGLLAGRGALDRVAHRAIAYYR